LVAGALLHGDVVLAETGPQETPLVASNQSVSLEEPQPREAAIPKSAEVAGIGDGQIPETVVGPELPAAVPPVSRTVARTPRFVSRGDVPETKSAVPWYRSGLGSLALVLTLVGGLYWFVRRWAPSTKAAENGVLRVVARASLTPKHGTALVQLGRRYILVGVSPTHVQTLCEVNEADEVADLMMRSGAALAPPAKRFDDVLVDHAAEYVEGAERTVESGRAASTLTGDVSRPVGDLLRRLRGVQV